VDKTCKTCGESKELGLFSPTKRGKLGCAAHCKRCAADKKSAWRAANPGNVREANQKHYANNAERLRADKREYNAENAERRAAYMTEYRALNPEARAEWGRCNPEKIAAIRHRRRARIANNGAEPYDILAVYEETDFRCAYCAGPIEHLDHIVPIARGGTDTRDNVTGACALCNQTKGDTLPDVWVDRVLSSDRPVWAR
jgi:5-methylcytosine-specific restriction endonuclease McrA